MEFSGIFKDRAAMVLKEEATMLEVILSNVG